MTWIRRSQVDCKHEAKTRKNRITFSFEDFVNLVPWRGVKETKLQLLSVLLFQVPVKSTKRVRDGSKATETICCHLQYLQGVQKRLYMNEIRKTSLTQTLS